MGLFRRRTSKLEFEPMGVKDCLIDMKDVSEQIIDLSYAAILFDSKDIADQVRDLEEEMDRLLHNIRIGVLLAARTRDDAEKLSGILQVATAAERIGDASEDLVELLGSGIEFRPFAPFFLKDADEKIWAFKVDPGSDLADRRIKDLSIEAETGARIIAIRRGSRWFYEIEGEHKIKSGDTLIVRGVEDGLRELRAYARGESKWGNYRR